MSGAKEVAEKAVGNIEQLLADMFAGDYADNEISLGVLLNGNEEIQVQLKITRTPIDFIDADYDEWSDYSKSIPENKG